MRAVADPTYDGGDHVLFPLGDQIREGLKALNDEATDISNYVYKKSEEFVGSPPPLSLPQRALLYGKCLSGDVTLTRNATHDTRAFSEKAGALYDVLNDGINQYLQSLTLNLDPRHSRAHVEGSTKIGEVAYTAMFGFDKTFSHLTGWANLSLEDGVEIPLLVKSSAYPESYQKVVSHIMAGSALTDQPHVRQYGIKNPILRLKPVRVEDLETVAVEYQKVARAIRKNMDTVHQASIILRTALLARDGLQDVDTSAVEGGDRLLRPANQWVNKMLEDASQRATGIRPETPTLDRYLLRADEG